MQRRPTLVGSRFLINTEGILYSPRHGCVAFDLPGFERRVRDTQGVDAIELPPPRRRGHRDGPTPPAPSAPDLAPDL